MWTPISLEELNEMMHAHQAQMNGKELRLWNIIKIKPQKWSEENYGGEGGGFWVVGIFGQSVMWYNDIEGGFNISSYSSAGKIDEYACSQDELYLTTRAILRLIENGDQPSVRGVLESLSI
jgi:hypothetical protein